MHLGLLNYLPDLLVVLFCNLSLQATHILVKVLLLRRPRDGNNIVALRHQEREHQLARRATPFVCDLLDRVHELEVLREVFFAEARREPAEIALFKVIRRFQRASQETTAERAVGHDGNTQLAAGSHEPDLRVFDVHSERAIFDLDGVDMLDCARAAECVGAALAQTEVFDLARLLQLGHHADRLFDRDVCVYTMAVVEIDMVDAKASERLVAGFADVVRVVAHFARAVRSDPVGELGGEEDVIALAGSLEPSSRAGSKLC